MVRFFFTVVLCLMQAIVDGSATEVQQLESQLIKKPSEVYWSRIRRLMANLSMSETNPSATEPFQATDVHMSCIIEIPEIRQLKGKCITLVDGSKACSAGVYMEPSAGGGNTCNEN